MGQFEDLAKPDGASKIGYQAPGAGSVATTVEKKLAEVVSPLDKGAIGNGIADDSAAFNLLEAQVKHREVDLGGRIFKVTSEFYGNLYYNGYFKVGNTLLRQSLPSSSPIGAGQPDYNSNNFLRYDIASINGQTISRGAQALCFNERTRHLFLLEADRINRYPMDGDISVFPSDYTQPASPVLGHQGLAIEYLPNNDFRLWTTSKVVGRAAARVVYSPNAPIDASEEYTLFTETVFANSTSCTPTISYDGKYLLAHGTRFGSAYITVIRVFDLAKLILGGPGDYTDRWLYEWETQGLVGDVEHPLQGLACDGKNVFCLSGGTGFEPERNKRLYTFSLEGKLIAKEEQLTIGSAMAAGDGQGVKWEPEGLSIMGGPNGATTLMVGVLSGDVSARRFRIYGVSQAKPLSLNKIDFVGNSKSSIQGSTANNRHYLTLRASDDLNTGSGINLYGANDSSNPGGYGLFTNGSTRHVVSPTGNSLFRSDTAVSPSTTQSNGSGRVIEFSRSGIVNAYMSISTVDSSWCGINGVGLRIQTGVADTVTTRWSFTNEGHLTPFAAGYNLGAPSTPVNNSYFAVAPTITSDADYKLVREGGFTDAELDAWGLVEGKVYQIRDAIAEKAGSDNMARYHFGYVAQDVIAAFKQVGLDAFTYGLVGEDNVYENRPLTHKAWRQKVEVVNSVKQVVEIVGGVPTRKLVPTTLSNPVIEMIQVISEDGTPLFEENGQPWMEQVPVMEEVDEVADNLVLVGKKLSLRYAECEVLASMYLRRELRKLQGL